MLHEGCSEMI